MPRKGKHPRSAPRLTPRELASSKDASVAAWLPATTAISAASTLDDLHQQQQWLQDMQHTLSKPGASWEMSTALCDVLCSLVRKLCQLLGREEPSALLQQHLRISLQTLEVHCCVLAILLRVWCAVEANMLQQQQQQQQHDETERERVATGSTRWANRKIANEQLLHPLASACDTLSKALEQQQQQQQQAAGEQQREQQQALDAYAHRLLLSGILE
uniref:Uncharacterized protein n=1 Tax=Tetradesmus obliquus TaxID=3088 RepID=A0A383V9J6_TETOB|eukprot:jgi/Sobl393_1/10696/SZX74732.1